MTSAEKQIKVQIAQRGTLRASATKAIQAIQIAFAAVPKNTLQVRAKVELLKDLKEKLAHLDTEIVQLADDTTLEDEVTRAAQYQENIFSAITESNIKLNDMIPATPTTPANSSNLNRDTAPKLPKLEIPKFNGQPLRWEEFWDNFQACIHDRSDLPDIDKFKYLKAFLEGEALRMVEGYRLTTANYSEVIQALKERFGDPEMAVFAHFEALIALSPVSYELSELRGVLDECESHIRSLVALGLPESTFGVVFTPLIISKLPKFVKMELYRKNGSQKWTLANLRSLLKDEISAREKCDRLFASPSDKQLSHKAKPALNTKSAPSPAIKKPSGGSLSLLTSPTQSNAKREPPGCAFCSRKHFSGECRMYPDVDSRRKRLQNQCYCCLRKGHNAKECRSKRPCYFCRRDSHHQSLCPQKYANKVNEQEESMVASAVPQPQASTATNNGSGARANNLSIQSPHSKAVLQTALADVKGKAGTAHARLYFDTGGSRSFISTSMAKKIGAKFVGEESVSVGRFRDSHHATINYRVYEFDVCLPGGAAITVRMSAENSISCPIQLVPVHGTVFQNVKLAEPLVMQPTLVPIDVLIGNDYYYSFIGETQIRCPNGIVLLESPFGFVTGGALVTPNETGGFSSSLFLHASPIPDRTDTIERFWSLEDLGIKDDPYRSDDEQALKQFNESVKFEDHRYSVKWPWKEKSPDLLSNYALAFGRLKSLVNRIGENKMTFLKYHETVSDQLKKEIIEEAPQIDQGIEHYLPHHCVITPSKTTTKLRVVYDASAKTSKEQLSLNECLHRGPVFLSNLVGMIIRWRLPKVAMISDIEKAFLQVGLQKKDRDVTRFLWLKDINKPFSQENIRIYRFCRVPFGVISSPFLLAATVSHHLLKSGSKVAMSMQRNVYVDNIFGGASNTDEALSYYKEAKALLRAASMNLREWYINSSEVLSLIELADKGNGQSTSVLGLKWDLDKDSFTIPTRTLVNLETECWTKRHVLQALASVFDPCGLLAPVTIPGKVLMQQLWKDKWGWDDKLPDALSKTWQSVLVNLKEVPAMQITRQLSMSIGETDTLQLHCFCDASKTAYATAVYLRIANQTRTASDLLFAKSKVAPVKQISVPRLELLAVLIGVRAVDFVRKEIDRSIDSIFVWTDSLCVLQWITRRPVTTVFVQNRLREICSYTDIVFGHVPSAENPADLPTRGADVKVTFESQLWWHGPSWLGLDTNSWPKSATPSNSTMTSEERDAEASSSNLIAADWKLGSHFVDLRRYSDVNKLYRITAYCHRFISGCRRVKRSINSVILGSEITAARRYWDKEVQSQCFPGMLENRSSKKYSSLQRQLGLFADSFGVIRCKGRLPSSVVDAGECPKLLPKHHPYTDLVIMDSHKKVLHSGVKHTLAAFRTQYWVTHSRNQVKKVMKNCKLCRFYGDQRYRTPDPPPLPDFRSQPSKPFEIVGLDYLGPLLIRHPNSRDVAKVWICLYTCATIRAVHLELVEDMSTEQFLLAFRRFLANYGRPKLIISDNARQFQTANRTIARIWSEIVQSNAIQTLSSKHEIQWKFITELAPWMGGFYERMVGVVKNSLKKTIQNRCLTFVELQTLLGEIVTVVNSRPLLYTEELAEHDYLSPSHFLCKATEGFPTITLDEEYTPTGILADELILKWRRLQSRLDEFWKTWRSSYLQSLQEHIWRPRNRNVSRQSPSIGTVVIIKDSSKRATWKLGMITKLVTSNDGNVRSAIVSLASGSQLRRPVSLLFPLESSVDPAGVVANIRKTALPTGRRSMRAAALKARENITTQALDEGVE